MFAKIFGQIFDSSIADDYNCRRMFMDLLVLADSDGVVDMTPEAISRRCNVPMEEVTKYIGELQSPDPRSRQKQHGGKRLVPLDSSRAWGWRIVNYKHYRQIRDEEARRSYFRDKQREYRSKTKSVKDKKVSKLNSVENTASASSLSNKNHCNTEHGWIDDLSKSPAYQGIDVNREYAKMLEWCKIKKSVPTKRRFVNWLNRIDAPLMPVISEIGNGEW